MLLQGLISQDAPLPILAVTLLSYLSPLRQHLFIVVFQGSLDDDKEDGLLGHALDSRVLHTRIKGVWNVAVKR